MFQLYKTFKQLEKIPTHMQSFFYCFKSIKYIFEFGSFFLSAIITYYA